MEALCQLEGQHLGKEIRPGATQVSKSELTEAPLGWGSEEDKRNAPGWPPPRRAC